MTRHVLLPLVAGLAWLWAGASAGLLGFLFCVIPGALGTASGVMIMDDPEEVRGREIASLASLAGCVFALPAWAVLGPVPALFLLVLSGASLIATGSYTVDLLPALDEVPAPEPKLALSAKVAVDEALLGGMGLRIPLPGRADARRIAHEVAAAHELYEARGWFEKPEDYHRAPLPLEVPKLEPGSTRTRRGTLRFERMSFESEYEPYAEEPGRDRWLSYAPNRTAHAWVLRHDGAPRPWLVCIHGYQMGFPIMDFGLFDPGYLHDKLGFNLLVPVLPLHGPRRVGRMSGDGFISGDTLDTIHAESQAIWDIRRMIGWVEQQEPTSIGAMGVSLGGYTVSLLSGLVPGLSGVIAGVPVTDFADLFWDHGPAGSIRDFMLAGIQQHDMNRVMRVISPLAYRCQVPADRRAIYGGIGDRLVPARQVRDLWRHWDRPEMVWYQGSHISFMGEPHVRDLVSRHLTGMQT